MKRRMAAGIVALGVLAIGHDAGADLTKDQCVGANAKAQDLRREGHLAAARQQLQACAAKPCPAIVQSDCVRRLDELEKVQPTVVFTVKDGGGRDITAVAISVDGHPLAESVGGTELQVDPGPHTFAFSVAGQPPVEKTIVLAEGDKGRREAVVVGGGEPAPVPRQPAHLVVAADEKAAIALDGKVVAAGRLDAEEPSGPHTLSITEPGMRAYDGEIDLHEGETRTLQVTLEPEHRARAWPWIVGGAAVAIGAGIGAYFLFKPSDTVTPVPAGKFAGATLASWRP